MAESQRVYLVFSGHYSDTEVHGVFSSEDRANAYIDRCGAHMSYDPRVEERTLDGEETTRPERLYSCRLRLSDGAFVEAWSFDYLWKEGDDGAGWGSPEPITVRGEQCIIGTSRQSADHARKVAVERRQQWLASRDQRDAGG
jgi:hypothetical protein